MALHCLVANRRHHMISLTKVLDCARTLPFKSLNLSHLAEMSIESFSEGAGIQKRAQRNPEKDL